jgi:hypothetical protein
VPVSGGVDGVGLLGSPHRAPRGQAPSSRGHRRPPSASGRPDRSPRSRHPPRLGLAAKPAEHRDCDPHETRR